MDWLQFLSSVIGSIAWPSAVVLLAILMRAPLGKLLPLIRTLKYKDLQIDIGEQLEAVREKVGAEGEAPDVASEEPPLSFKKLAQADPRAAILSAWIPVEIELNEIAKKIHVETRRGAMDLIGVLRRHGILDRLTSETLDQLRRIRNTAVHVTEESVSFDDAIHMAEMCLWVNAQLKRISESIPAQPA
ncbi:DUF4145 domain-containing protein [Pseudomonas azotoformans]